jgi:hypothetical protein
LPLLDLWRGEAVLLDALSLLDEHLTLESNNPMVEAGTETHSVTTGTTDTTATVEVTA